MINEEERRLLRGFRNVFLPCLAVWAMALHSCDASAQPIDWGLTATSNHISNYKASNASDCSTDFVGGGLWAEWKAWELEGALGKRRLLCGWFRDTSPGGYLSVKWKKSVREWRSR